MFCVSISTICNVTHDKHWKIPTPIHHLPILRELSVKNAVYRNTPGEEYFTVSMVTHTVTTETVKYCSPGVFSYTAFFTVCVMVLSSLILAIINDNYYYPPPSQLKKLSMPCMQLMTCRHVAIAAFHVDGAVISGRHR